MRLRTFESFWLIKNGLLYSYPSLRNTRLHTEIAVVGGGITGALISYSLIQAGYKVILLDKRDIAMGSTSATTSMLQYEIDVSLTELSKKVGNDDAALAYTEGIKAIDTLAKLIAKEKIDCGFEKNRSLYVAHNKSQAGKLHKEYEARKACGIDVKWMTAEAIKKQFGIVCHGGILSQVAAYVDAYQLAHELLKISVERGLQVYDQTEIKKIDHQKNSVKIYTKEDAVVTCKNIVYCAGYETTEMLQEKIADIFTTYACISEQNISLKKPLQNLLVWDTNDPYFYMRTTDDGRLIIGGADDPTDKKLDVNKKESQSKKLIKQLQKKLPGIDFINDFTWAGKFGTTKDGLPYIGNNKKYANSFYVLGFGGNGITFSVQGMQMITDWLQGKENRLHHIYRFGR